MKVICDYCGKEFDWQYAWYKRAKTHCCSRVCSDKLKISNHTKKCKYCGKEYHSESHQKDSIYCSRQCKSMDSRKQVKLYCNTCGKEYFVNNYRKDISRFCSRKCLNVYTGHLASLRVGEKNPSYKGFKDQKRSDKSKLKSWANVIKRRDKVCVLCGSNNNLQSHHIKSYAEYPELRFDFSNGILLCGKCHALQHVNDKISVKQLILS